MRFDIITLFPAMFCGPFSESILKRAIEKGLIQIEVHNLRDFAFDKHRVTDDYPYGGGSGMVMKVDPIGACVQSLQDKGPAKVVLTTPRGCRLSQKLARDLAAEERLIIICGRYEGVDERVRELYVDYEISIGDFILTGGELAAMVLVDALGRLIPGVLGSDESSIDESFSDGLLEYPQFTRPAEFNGLEVPQVLLSGNHLEIAKWRRREALKKTLMSRPDLLEVAELNDEDRRFLNDIEESLKS